MIVFTRDVVRRLHVGLIALATIGIFVAACNRDAKPASTSQLTRFDSDLQFLQAHTKIVLLSEPSGAQVAVAPAYQGRVMTSTTGGTDAPSFGWLGRAAIASGQKQPHMNAFGGEDRFWLGPEGGQYALFFKHGDPFDLDHWQTPEPIDWGAWDMFNPSPTAVGFEKRMTLQNYAGTTFDLDVKRTIRLMSNAEIAAQLKAPVPNTARAVGFETANTVTNAGKAPWQKETGLVSMWILGQFNPSPQTTIVIPIAQGQDSAAAPAVNDAYFGKVPPDRLIVKDGVVFFRGDGQYRSKIGVPPSRALTAAGSYDAASGVLTVVTYSGPRHAPDYVNSTWGVQREPYGGDVINGYNDGAPAPGKPPLGPFYELETSSPALDLAPGATFTHVHRTFHLTGPEADLDRIAHAALHVGLADITKAFPPH